MEQNLLGWELVQTEFTNSAQFARPSQNVELELFETTEHQALLSISFENGLPGSYEQISLSAKLPLEVLVSMMQHAGYTVSK